MKNLLHHLVLLVLCLASIEVNGQYANLPDKQVLRSDEQRYGHLQYFGFYASAMGSWNYTQELAPFTNMTWIHVGSGDDVAGGIESMLQRMREARDSGVQATLSIETFLFANDKGDLRSETEILDFLIELRARLEFEGLMGSLAMIYPKDEPFRNFIQAIKPNVFDQYVTGKVYNRVHSVLLQANALIKLVFPEKPIGVILSAYEVYNRFLAIPDNFDWVGFDCYDNLFEACDNRSFVELYGKLLSLMETHQRLMAVPETWVQNEDMNRPDWPDVLLSRLRHHYEIALNEPRFVAFIPFLWSFDSNIEVPGLGLNRMAELFDDGTDDLGTQFVDAVKAIGEQIKSGQPVFPNMAYEETEETRYRPPGNLQGEIMGITQKGLVSAWAFEYALPHKNLRVQIRVRDEAGRVFYKSTPERTFINDPGLADEDLIGQSFIGLPGYRFQLPQEIVARKQTQRLTVELLIYADGQGLAIGRTYSQTIGPGSKSPSGARRR